VKKLKKIYKQTSRRWTWFLYRKRRILKTKLENLITDNIKLHIGCGDKKLEGYINIDIVPTEGTDVVMDVAKELYLIPSNIAIEIRIESVFEHFYRYQQGEILQEFQRILKSGGKLIIKWLPDFNAIIEAYLKKEKGIVGEKFDLFNIYRLTHGDPTPKNSPQQLHKDIFTKESIRMLLESNGFQIQNMKNEIFPQEELALSINTTAIRR
jgi:predicted SAM-dependent methyltransferase